MEKAVKWNYIKENVAKNVNIPKNYNKPKKEQEIYNNEEIKQLFNALEMKKNLKKQWFMFHFIQVQGVERF